MTCWARSATGSGICDGCFRHTVPVAARLISLRSNVNLHATLMNNEDAQAIKHAVSDAIRAAQHMCPHCGTPWTLWQRRGYDKHPCEAWRTERATGHPSDSTRHLSNVTEALAAGATVTMHGQGGSGGSK